MSHTRYTLAVFTQEIQEPNHQEIFRRRMSWHVHPKYFGSYFRLSQYELQPLQTTADSRKCFELLRLSVEELPRGHVVAKSALCDLTQLSEKSLLKWLPEYGCSMILVRGSGRNEQYLIYLICLDGWEFDMQLAASGSREYDSSSHQHRVLFGGKCCVIHSSF